MASTTSNTQIEPPKAVSEHTKTSDSALEQHQHQPSLQPKLEPTQPVSILSRAPSPLCPSPNDRTIQLPNESPSTNLPTSNKTKFVSQTSPRLGPVAGNPTTAQGGGLLLQDLSVVNQSGLVNNVADGISKAWKADKRRATPYPKLEEGDHYEFDGVESQHQNDSEDTQDEEDVNEEEDEDNDKKKEEDRNSRT